MSPLKRSAGDRVNTESRWNDSIPGNGREKITRHRMNNESGWKDSMPGIEREKSTGHRMNNECKVGPDRRHYVNSVSNFTPIQPCPKLLTEFLSRLLVVFTFFPPHCLQTAIDEYPQKEIPYPSGLNGRKFFETLNLSSRYEVRVEY